MHYNDIHIFLWLYNCDYCTHIHWISWKWRMRKLPVINSYLFWIWIILINLFKRTKKSNFLLIIILSDCWTHTFIHTIPKSNTIIIISYAVVSYKKRLRSHCVNVKDKFICTRTHAHTYFLSFFFFSGEIIPSNEGIYI